MHQALAAIKIILTVAWSAGGALYLSARQRSLHSGRDLARQNELKPMALCEPCQGIQRNWRKAPGHAELVQRGNRKEDREQGPVTITRYVCDRCGTAWEYENDKDNQKAGWSVVGR